MIAGSAGGYFKTGRYIKFPNGTSMNDFLVSIANAMGVAPSSNGMSNRFGDTAFCKGRSAD